ncbi:hypothetical protein THF1C08_260007 [Vibrio jasicida]|uniref:Uncharacterized protein n=1 Tax=Vibrio jasicida TaxID=766224 RepID=A0AAU9QVE8_9VIBR|nr:hypothetical protein THF1C08_260007 [Vibrio jasicida]CAH1602979.1 hypothetical protein THF1A12_610007 [Vibrio jasicida]
MPEELTATTLLHAELPGVPFTRTSNVIRDDLLIHTYTTGKVTRQPNNVLFPGYIT